MHDIGYDLKKIQRLREINDLTQVDIAELLGLSRQGYHRKEKGERKFTISEAKKLADIYSTSIDDLFFSHDSNHKGYSSTA